MIPFWRVGTLSGPIFAVSGVISVLVYTHRLLALGGRLGPGGVPFRSKFMPLIAGVREAWLEQHSKGLAGWQFPDWNHSCCSTEIFWDLSRFRGKKDAKTNPWERNPRHGFTGTLTGPPDVR